MTSSPTTTRPGRVRGVPGGVAETVTSASACGGSTTQPAPSASQPGGTAMPRFRVEFVPAGGDGRTLYRDTALSAMLIAQPVARWRVMALRQDGTTGPSSAWSRLVPAPR